MSPEESRELAKQIGATRLFAKYERSFTAASGLPLTLRPIGALQKPAGGHAKENPFCSLLSESGKACLACLMAQSELENSVKEKSGTQPCFAGLHETLVPIRTGRRIVAFLQTGQVALGKLDSSDFDRLRGELAQRKIDIDSESARKAYFQSVLLSRDAYLGFIKMLEIFAENLGLAANTLRVTVAERSSHPIASKAIRYIRDHCERPIRLEEIAAAAGASTRNFSKVFKQETGLTFVDYLTRERIEKAKQRVSGSTDRICDIAFACGFESIAQFNRAFKRVAGESPSAFRIAANS